MDLVGSHLWSCKRQEGFLSERMVEFMLSFSTNELCRWHKKIVSALGWLKWWSHLPLADFVGRKLWEVGSRRRSCGTDGVVLTLAFQSMNYDEGEINNRNNVLT